MATAWYPATAAQEMSPITTNTTSETEVAMIAPCMLRAARAIADGSFAGWVVSSGDSFMGRISSSGVYHSMKNRRSVVPSEDSRSRPVSHQAFGEFRS